MVNLKALERSLAKIEAVGYDELDFEVDGIKVVLRPISPEEENEVERYSRSAYNEDAYRGATDPLALTPNELADAAAAKNIGANDGEPTNEEQTEAIIRNRNWIDRLRRRRGLSPSSRLMAWTSGMLSTSKPESKTTTATTSRSPSTKPCAI